MLIPNIIGSDCYFCFLLKRFEVLSLGLGIGCPDDFCGTYFLYIKARLITLN
jgi:hypothetical protein